MGMGGEIDSEVDGGIEGGNPRSSGGSAGSPDLNSNHIIGTIGRAA